MKVSLLPYVVVNNIAPRRFRMRFETPLNPTQITLKMRTTGPFILVVESAIVAFKRHGAVFRESFKSSPFNPF